MDWLSSQEQKDQVLFYVKKMLEEQEDKELAMDNGKKNKDNLTQGLPEGPEPKRPRLFSFLPKCLPNVENQRGSEGEESTVSVSFVEAICRGRNSTIL